MTKYLLDPKIFNSWLMQGERGISSEAIVSRLTGVQVGRRYAGNHPYDPADLRRCVALLEAVPVARLQLHLMADVSPAWAALVANWEELERTLTEEMEAGSKAPKTYARMQELIR